MIGDRLQNNGDTAMKSTEIRILKLRLGETINLDGSEWWIADIRHKTYPPILILKKEEWDNEKTQ